MFEQNFYAAEAQSHADIQSEFGDRWVHAPCIRLPNFPPQPDSTRPPYGLIAIFQDLPRQIHVGLEETGISSRDPKLTVQITNLRYAVSAGDVFTRCSTGEKYEVTDVKPDGVSGVEMDLVQRGIQAGTL